MDRISRPRRPRDSGFDSFEPPPRLGDLDLRNTEGRCDKDGWLDPFRREEDQRLRHTLGGLQIVVPRAIFDRSGKQIGFGTYPHPLCDRLRY